MNKYYGKVGYAVCDEDPQRPGIWRDRIIEVNYYGDVLKNISKWNISSEKVNDDKDTSAQISIVADPFAFDNFASIKYIEFMGTLWKVTSVEIRRPRLILSIGGVYNGQQASTAE